MSDVPDFGDPREYQDWLAEQAELDAAEQQRDRQLDRRDRDLPLQSTGGVLLTELERLLIIRALGLLAATRMGTGDPVGAIRCTQLARRIQG